jgi:hypothetical protein
VRNDITRRTFLVMKATHAETAPALDEHRERQFPGFVAA